MSQSSSDSGSGIGCALGCLIIAVVGAVLWVNVTPEPSRYGQTPEAKADPAKVDDIVLRILAEDAVRMNLKWPDDASFDWGKEIGYNPNRSAAGVRGKVIVKNIFGATLTYRYQVLFVRAGKDWKLEKVQIGN